MGAIFDAIPGVPDFSLWRRRGHRLRSDEPELRLVIDSSWSAVRWVDVSGRSRTRGVLTLTQWLDSFEMVDEAPRIAALGGWRS